MICNQLHGTIALPTSRIAPSTTKPSTADLRCRQWPEVRPQHPAEVAHRVAGGRDFIFERAAFRFVRLIDAPARAVELPTVIGTTNPVLVRNAIRERRAPMRADLIDQSE